MEIIKRGTPPGERDYKGSCRNCGTEVKFKHKEAQTSNDQRDGDYTWVNCPICNAIIYGTEIKLYSRPSNGSQWEDR